MWVSVALEQRQRYARTSFEATTELQRQNKILPFPFDFLTLPQVPAGDQPCRGPFGASRCIWGSAPETGAQPMSEPSTFASHGAGN